ncbi:MAG: P-loop NTPase [Coriobacteriia bacterium]|nr:P-loop NTPase [Coriobacteriia bacterium]
MNEVVLCADEEALRNPSIMGLDGESLDSQQWLLPMSDACEARDYFRAGGEADEVWVTSSDEVDPINLAAALKRDCRKAKVCLVAWKGTGSLVSRANAAGIDEVIGYSEMIHRYASMKDAFRAANPRRRTPQNPVPHRQTRPVALPREDYASEGEADLAHEEETAASPDAMDGRDSAVLVEPAATSDGEGAGAAPQLEAEDGVVKRGYVLCVASASGGTGKSTIAALAALIAAGHGYKTAIIDADLQFGDIATMFGEIDAITLDKAVADPRLMVEAAREDLPVVVSSLERIEQSELYLSQVPGLVDWASEAFDVVVVNTGSFWTESHVQMIEVSTNTLFLMDQRPTSVQTVRKALELCARCGVAANPFLFAVNRCTRKSLLSSIDISCALNGAPVAELRDGGQAVAELMSAGMASKLISDHNELCVSLNDFLGGVIPVALNGGVPKPAPVPELKGKRKGKSRRKMSRGKGRAACL